MPSYLVETFLPGDAVAGCSAREWRARSAAGDLRRQGVRVRFDRVIHVPGEERCVFVFDAASRREAALAAELAQLDPFRVVEAAPREERAGTG
ncbi:MAG: hypothetical protein ACRDNY_03725 [Gaiellaceae bacterium]